MKKLIVIRSGSACWETDSNSVAGENIQQPEDEKRLQGTLPLPLNDTDQEVLRDVAALLRHEDISCMYSSGNESSGPTSEFLAKLCSLKTKIIPLLHELDCGLWQGMKIGDIKQRFGNAYKQWRLDPVSICPPEGESFQDACDRIWEALQKIAKKNRNGTVVIVAAPFVAAIIECIVTDSNICGCLKTRRSLFKMETEANTPNLSDLWDYTDSRERMTVFERSEEGSFREVVRA